MVVAILIVLGGCAVTSVETPDPAAVPSGTLRPHGSEPTGDIVELGQGVALDHGWRYSIYPSDDGWCTQLELSGVSSAGCGDPLPAGGDVFGGIGFGEAAGIQTVEGMVTADTATVWLIGEDNMRAPATLMSLEPAGLEHLAFVGFAPPDIVLTHLMAVARNGDVLDTIEVP
jgi:hypothetical protein